MVVQLQHEILSLNKIVDDTTNEEQLYKEIQLTEDVVLTNEHHDVSENVRSPAVAKELGENSKQATN